VLAYPDLEPGQRVEEVEATVVELAKCQQPFEARP
jgi:hypothetical protein